MYVDGLNLYRQKLAFHPHLKWLDLVTLAENMLPSHEIVLVRYFTALIKPAAFDEDALFRQRQYLRALETIGPRLKIHLGRMTVAERKYASLPKAFDETGRRALSRVQKIEEKETDVSIAAHMVLDACTTTANIYVLVSTDSDFAPALRILREDIQARTGLFSPIENPSKTLLRELPLIIKIVRKSVLERSQLSPTLYDAKGLIQKPDTWQ